MERSFKAHRPQPARWSGRVIGISSGGQTAPGEDAAARPSAAAAAPRPKEIGGPKGPEPTRYGDWERKGICVDF